MEWSKSQARKMRWEEEVEILQEEMRRMIVYYEWKQKWWLEENSQAMTIDDTIQHGITAYSQKQAHYRYKRLMYGKSRSDMGLDMEKELSDDGSYEGEFEEGEKYDTFEIDD